MFLPDWVAIRETSPLIQRLHNLRSYYTHCATHKQRSGRPHPGLPAYAMEEPSVHMAFSVDEWPRRLFLGRDLLLKPGDNIRRQSWLKFCFFFRSAKVASFSAMVPVPKELSRDV